MTATLTVFPGQAELSAEGPDEIHESLLELASRAEARGATGPELNQFQLLFQAPEAPMWPRLATMKRKGNTSETYQQILLEKVMHTLYMSCLIPEEEQRAYLVPNFSRYVR